MRWTFAVFVSVALAAAIVGCSSSPSATPTLAPGVTAAPTQAPGTTPAPTLAPTQTPGGPTQLPPGLTGHECDAVPTFDLTNPDPATPVPDTTLSAHFPATIDGQPVTDVQSMQWLYLICQFGGQTALNSAASGAGPLGIATMSYGSASATVDGESVDLTAFRTPGGDANTIVQALATLAAQSGTTINPGDVTATNISGKNVYVWTDTDGVKGYAYPSGDTLVMFSDVTDSQAAKILAALP